MTREPRFRFVSTFRSEISGRGELEVEIGGERYFVCVAGWADRSSHWGGREMQWTEARLYLLEGLYHVVVQEIVVHEGGREQDWKLYRLARERLEQPPRLEEEGFAETWRCFERVSEQRPGFVETTEPIDTFVLRS